MNGIVPPSPNVRAGLPNAAVDASSSAADSHGANDGAFQPGAACVSVKRTGASYGTSDGQRCARAPPARRPGRMSAGSAR